MGSRLVLNLLLWAIMGISVYSLCVTEEKIATMSEDLRKATEEIESLKSKDLILHERAERAIALSNLTYREAMAKFKDSCDVQDAYKKDLSDFKSAVYNILFKYLGLEYSEKLEMFNAFFKGQAVNFAREDKESTH